MAAGIYSLQEDDQETMKGIAVQCPFSGGKAVYKVRAYLAMLGDTTLYDDETVCEEDENFRKASKENTTISIMAFPNPTRDICRFKYSLPKDEKATLKIYDSYSKLLIEKDLGINSQTISIDLRWFTSGFYIFSVVSENGLIGNGKIAILK